MFRFRFPGHRRPETESAPAGGFQRPVSSRPSLGKSTGCFFPGSSSGYDGKARIVADLPPGTSTVCWVDPEDPTQAVLSRRLTAEYLFALIPLVFVAVGAGGIVMVLVGARGKRKRAQAGRPEWLPEQAAEPAGGGYEAFDGGGGSELSWTFSGRPGRIRRLQVSLEGVEEADYTRGTDRRTDRETFATFAVVDSTQPMEIAQGVARVSIPADTMHTFEAPDNRFLWTLKVHGEIRYWPDVQEEFRVVVHPLTLEHLP